jgi:hypothetical protein
MIILKCARSAALRALMETLEARIAVRAAQAAMSRQDLPAMPRRKCVASAEVPCTKVPHTSMP